MHVTKKFAVTFADFREVVRSFRFLNRVLPQPVNAERVLTENTSLIDLIDSIKLTYLDAKGQLTMSYEARRDLSTGKSEIIYIGSEEDFGYGDIGHLWGCNRNSPVVYGEIETSDA